MNTTPAPDPEPDEEPDDRMMIPPTTPLMFPAEENLEDYLESQLPILVSPFGQDLLIIGRQVGGLIDLLAIDSTGVIYIIELKLNKAFHSIIPQLLVYQRWLNRLNREKLIGVVADGVLKVDLAEDFKRHFGHPLPATVNESQALLIIAATIHPDTAEAILALKDREFSCTTFRYVVQPEAVSLIPCCRDDQDVEEGSHVGTRQPTPSIRATGAMPARSVIYRVYIDEDIRRFWRIHAPYFTPFVTFRYVYNRYKHWRQTQAAEGSRPRVRQDGDFGRQLYALTSESADWMRIYIPPDSNMRAYETIEVPPSWRTSICAGHRIAAYMRNPADRASEL